MTETEAIEYLTKRGQNTLITHLEMQFVAYKNGVLSATMPVNEHTCQVSGYLNGGASLALAECLAGSASALLCGPNEAPMGTQVSGNHVSSTRKGDVAVAECSAIHVGKTTHVWNVDVRSQQTGKILSSIRVMNFIRNVK